MKKIIKKLLSCFLIALALFFAGCSTSVPDSDLNDDKTNIEANDNSARYGYSEYGTGHTERGRSNHSSFSR